MPLRQSEFTPEQLWTVQNICQQVIAGQLTLQQAERQLQLMDVAADEILAILTNCRLPSEGTVRPNPAQEIPTAYNVGVPGESTPVNIVPQFTPTPPQQTQETSQVPPDMPPIDIPIPIETQIPEEIKIGHPIKSEETTCPEGEHCKQIIIAVDDLLTEITKAVDEQITETIDECIRPITHIENVTIGHIDRCLDHCETDLGKCYNRILKPINNAIGECGGYLSQCGCCYPTPEQVCYGLETGNYMESVGICGPQQTQQPADSQEPCTVQNIENQYNMIQNQQVSTTTGISPAQPTQPISVTVPVTVQESQTVTVGGPEYYPLIPDISIQVVGEPPPPPPPPPEPPKDLPAPRPKDDLGIKPGDATVKMVPNWSSPSVCAALQNQPVSEDVDNVIGFYISAGGKRVVPNWWAQAWNTPAYESWGTVKKWGHDALWSVIHGGKDILKAAVVELKSSFRCDRFPLDAVLAKVLGGFINQFTAGSLDSLLKGFDYKLNEGCPQEIPSQSEINSARLNDQMTDEQWECLTRANNNLPGLARRVLNSEREHISLADALKLYRLGRISRESYLDWARQNKIITIEDLDAYEKAAIDVPSVSDLIRMMVHDVGDAAVIKEYSLDAEFKDKWKGSLEIMGKAQGIDSEIALLHWMSHWTYPSNTQAFEMFHRLRPDSDFAKRLDAESKGKGGHGVFTSFDQLTRLLAVNDLAPFWRDRLAAIAFRPMTRTDAQRAFQIGALGPTPEEQNRVLKGIYQDEGYSPETADVLVRFTNQLDKDRKARKSWPKGTTEYVKNYVDGLWNLGQLKDALDFLSVNAEQQKAILRLATDKRKMVIYKNKVDCIRRSYMLGVLDDVKAKDALTAAGMDPALSVDNVDNWWCKKKGKQREVTAAKLCEWREKKLITADQQLNRLVNLGYTVDDAHKIVQECEIDVSQKAYKAMLANLKKEQVLAEKQKKAAERQQKQAFKASSQNGSGRKVV